MAGRRVVGALAALCAARAMTTNATWCSARNHRRLAGGCVHSLRPALPHAAASRLGALLQRAWQQNSFLYATNCRRSGNACECGNKKMRMRTKDSAPAQAAAVYCRDKRGGFIYSKHELDRSSTAHAILAKTVDALIRPRLEDAIGGPVSNLYAELAGRRSPPCGYCALYCFERATARPGGWEARLVANQEHLARVPEAALGGPNDFAEQDGE